LLAEKEIESRVVARPLPEYANHASLLQGEPPVSAALLPRRVVIGGNTYADLATALHDARPDLEIRANTLGRLTPADLEWGDTYLGFRRPPLASMGNIRWVHCTGAGVDSWLYPVELPREILLTRSSESFGPMIAEWALARALAFTQQLLDVAECQRRHEWSARDIAGLRGTMAVVVGIGDVGSHVARAFKAMGCSTIGISRSGMGDSPIFDEIHAVSWLKTAVARADWLIVTLPLTAQTDGLISREVLAMCKGAVLMNAGRGKLVDERVIPVALNNGWLSGAALDVFEVEPLPASSPLWDDRRVMVSPHISGITTSKGAIGGFMECVAELTRGELPGRTVDRTRQY
jgi:D-2-hydroxyacid dehydrogenase (NADP+)